MRGLDHFLITRFNLSSMGRSRGLDPEWLANRLELFERYCVPSVAEQEDTGFVWILLMHPRTPDDVRERIRRATADTETLQVPARAGSIVDMIRRVLAERGLSGSYLVTSRLDNDDALHRDYVKRLHEAFRGQELECVDFPWGYTYDPRASVVHRCRMDNNPFISLVERASDRPTTVYADQHSLIERVAPVLRLDDAPAWLQVVHGSNIRQRMKGTPIDVDLDRFLIENFGVHDPAASPRAAGAREGREQAESA